MRNFWKEIEKEKRPVVIHGTGDAAERLFYLLKEKGVRTMAFTSSSSFLRNRSFLGYKVLSIERVKEIYGEDIVILLGFGSHDKKVMEEIESLNRETELYMPDLMLSEKGECVEEDVLKRDKDRIEWAYSLLSDSMSRKVFSKTMEYRVTGRIEPLMEVNTPEEDNWDLLGIKRGDSFLDGGAYNGDTISLFIKKSGDYSYIYGFEPSSRSFGKLKEKYGGKENIYLYNAALSDKRRECGVTKGRGRGNKISDGEGLSVETIDNVLKGKGIGIIKLDTEGEEENVLEGARETIRNHKPRILLSAYHRHDDYWRLLEKIWSIRTDYKVYMRKSPSLPMWDVDYFLI